MLINKEKTIINEDKHIEGYWLIKDESLIDKILDNIPFFEFVLDGEGNLVDITPTEKPPQPPPEPSETELLAEYLLDVDFRVAMLELGLL